MQCAYLITKDGIQRRCRLKFKSYGSRLCPLHMRRSSRSGLITKEELEGATSAVICLNSAEINPNSIELDPKIMHMAIDTAKQLKEEPLDPKIMHLAIDAAKAKEEPLDPNIVHLAIEAAKAKEEPLDPKIMHLAIDAAKTKEEPLDPKIMQLAIDAAQKQKEQIDPRIMQLAIEKVKQEPKKEIDPRIMNLAIEATKEETNQEMNSKVWQLALATAQNQLLINEKVTVGTFNLLANGLSMTAGDFITEGGDSQSVDFNKRLPRLLGVLANMMEKCDILVTQENDIFFEILQHLQSTNQHIRGYLTLKVNETKDVKAGAAGNSRSIYIKTLINKIPGRKQFKVLPKFNPKGDDFGSHEEAYTLLNKYKDEIKAKTFLQMCGQNKIFAKALSNIYGRNIDDAYECDDGIGIYYKSNIVKCNEDNTITFNSDGYSVKNFVKNSMNFRIIGAHLPSGESSKDELERIKIFNDILELKLENTIFVMDSNVSVGYEKEIRQQRVDAEKDKVELPKIIAKNVTRINQLKALKTRTVDEEKELGKLEDIPKKLEIAQGMKVSTAFLSDILYANNLVDAVDPRGYECLKMRSMLGTQKDKKCIFMFDTIDKILYNPTEMIKIPTAYSRDEFGFMKYDLHSYQKLMNIRENRGPFKAICQKLEDTSDQKKIFTKEEMPESFYPNENAPSDHPPVTATFMFFQKK